MSGISLDTLAAAAAREHVHAETEAWRITSRVPVGPELLDCPVLESPLPGRLGCFVLPQDAVLDMPSKARVTRRDLNGILDSERVAAGAGARAPRQKQRAAPPGRAEGDDPSVGGDTDAEADDDDEDDEDDDEDDSGDSGDSGDSDGESSVDGESELADDGLDDVDDERVDEDGIDADEDLSKDMVV